MPIGNSGEGFVLVKVQTLGSLSMSDLFVEPQTMSSPVLGPIAHATSIYCVLKFDAEVSSGRSIAIMLLRTKAGNRR
jgi:hypothetical protein